MAFQVVREFFKTIMNQEETKELYDKIKKNDISSVVTDICECIKDDDLSEMPISTKCEELSEFLLENANKALKIKHYGGALKLYNRALLYAPPWSNAIRDAYYMRSELFYMIGEYTAALKDIAMCLNLGCPDRVMSLVTRQENCHKLMWKKNIQGYLRSRIIPTPLLKMKSEINPEVPCAMKSVSLNMDGPYPTFITTEDIKPGTLVVFETAFVSSAKDAEVACYYCQRLSFNLIPCEDCSIALFCDTICRDKCKKEYHAFECVINDTWWNKELRLALKSVIKIKNNCENWIEFIEAFKNVATKKDMRSVCNDKFSVLYKTKKCEMSEEQKLTQCLEVAVIIKLLCIKSSFFPVDLEMRKLAMKAFAGQIMHLIMNVEMTELSQLTLNVMNTEVKMVSKQYGLFPLIGKLKETPRGNVFAVGMNNKAALVAMRHIPKGSVLALSQLNHYDVASQGSNALYAHDRLNMICSCWDCDQKWHEEYIFSRYTLSECQKMFLRQVKIKKLDDLMSPSEFLPYYQDMCRGLHLFGPLKNTHLYRTIFISFCKCLIKLQYNETKNNVLLNDKSYLQELLATNDDDGN